MHTIIKSTTLDVVNLVLHPSSGIVSVQLPSAGNLKKYQTMNNGYSQDQDSAEHATCVNNEEIKAVETLKLLGVTIDSKLI